MVDDKRKSKRTDINVRIQLKKIQGGVENAASNRELEVHVVNISKDGIAFKTNELLAFNGLYDTEIVLSNKERFNSIIKIVRIENTEEPEILYGCHFVGINSYDQFKINVFQILCDSGVIKN